MANTITATLYDSDSKFLESKDFRISRIKYLAPILYDAERSQ